MVAAFFDGEEVDKTLRAVLTDVLGLSEDKVRGFDESSPLFGALPEFDSMAVAHFLTALEERLGTIIEDDDVEAEDFATFGTLLAFAERVAAK